MKKVLQTISVMSLIVAVICIVSYMLVGAVMGGCPLRTLFKDIENPTGLKLLPGRCVERFDVEATKDIELYAVHGNYINENGVLPIGQILICLHEMDRPDGKVFPRFSLDKCEPITLHAGEKRTISHLINSFELHTSEGVITGTVLYSDPAGQSQNILLWVAALLGIVFAVSTVTLVVLVRFSSSSS